VVVYGESDYRDVVVVVVCGESDYGDVVVGFVYGESDYRSLIHHIRPLPRHHCSLIIL
jgi:hypothetical protein